MKQELIVELFRRFEEACYLYKQIECWSARELQEVLGYTEWRNFLKVIDKAKTACENAGVPVPDHFVDVNKMIEIGKGGQRELDDVALTRYACYLVAQNGDPSKSEIALFGGYSTHEMKKKLAVPDTRPLADFLPTLTIKAKDFATELTSHNVIEKDLSGESRISDEHVENNRAVRRILIERGIEPEALPPAEDVRKVQRKLEGDAKRLPTFR